MRDESRDVATMYAAPREKQIIARAPRDAAQLHLALRRGRACVRPLTGEREPRVTLHALACGEERVTRGGIFFRALAGE